MVESDRFYPDPEDQAMASIVIKDLPDSIDLDRKAMIAITGGARTRGRPSSPKSTIFRSSRIVKYPAGFVSNPLADTKGRSTESKPRK
jgi:hypothetical protein